MDILTQGLLGANLAQTAAQKQHMRIAAVIGCLSGILADVDVLISSSSDPLLSLEYHRHFTHSIVFIPLGALTAALLIWPFVKNRLNFGRIYTFALLGYMLSGFIDACTSYGTHLFWPVYSQAVSFNIISIIDPVFTLLLLVTLVVAQRKRSHFAIKTGLLLVGLYLLFGWLQMQTASDVSRQLAAERGHYPDRLLVKPTLGNLLLWRSVYQANGRLYVDAIRLSLSGRNRVYVGESVELFNPEEVYPELSLSSVLYKDIRRFMEFSDNYVAIRPEQPNVLVDIRYSMLPNSIKPLWGIILDRDNPQKHADFTITRDGNEQTRNQFITLLTGGDLP